MDLREQLDSLKNHLQSAELEYEQLQGGKKASASRLRKSLMNMKTVSHTARGTTTNYMKALPTKPRTKKELVAVEPTTEPVVEPIFDEDGNQVVAKPIKKKPAKKKPVAV
jgi:uncharacterized protein (DUF3084 family)